MSEIYIYLLVSILIFFCVCTNTMYAVFSFIAYALLLFISLLFFRIEFLTLLFLIIYMGAIIVLFLFVIMLIEFRPLVIDDWEDAFIKMLFIFICCYLLFIAIININFNNNLNIIMTMESAPLLTDVNYFTDYLDIVEIGLIIYDSYIILFINITMLFLLGIISVVLLTKEKKMVERKKSQNLTYQKFWIKQ